MIKNYFKTAFRNLQRNKVYSLINILGLSLGLTCAMLIILYVKDEASYDRFHKNVSHICRVGMERINTGGMMAGKSGITGYFQGPKFTAGIPEIKSFVRLQNNQRDIKTGTEIQSKKVIAVDSNFFAVFSFPFIHGSPRAL